MFGYTMEDIDMVITPMVENSQEPISSMGNDQSLAVLSDRPQLLYNYFKQLFAQVTNPPIDPYRENLVMSLMSYVGREKNLLEETPEHVRQVKLPHPILSNDDMAKLRTLDVGRIPLLRDPMTFAAADGEKGLEKALDSPVRGGRGARGRRVHDAHPDRPRGQREAGADPGPAHHLARCTTTSRA